MLVDLLPISRVDVSGLFVVEDLATALSARGIRLAGAGRRTEWQHWMETRAVTGAGIELYPTLRRAMRARSTEPLAGIADEDDRGAARGARAEEEARMIDPHVQALSLAIEAMADRCSDGRALADAIRHAYPEEPIPVLRRAIYYAVTDPDRKG